MWKMPKMVVMVVMVVVVGDTFIGSKVVVVVGLRGRGRGGVRTVELGHGTRAYGIIIIHRIVGRLLLLFLLV